MIVFVNGAPLVDRGKFILETLEPTDVKQTE